MCGTSPEERLVLAVALVHVSVIVHPREAMVFFLPSLLFFVLPLADRTFLDDRGPAETQESKSMSTLTNGHLRLLAVQSRVGLEDFLDVDLGAGQIHPGEVRIGIDVRGDGTRET